MVKETANEMVKETAVEKSDGDSDSDVQIISVHEINKNSGNPSNLSPQTSSGNKDGHHKKSDSECATILPKFIKKQEDSNEQKSNTGGAHLVDSHTEEKNPSSDSRARSKIRLLADLSEGSVLHPTTSNVNVDTVTLESLVGSADLLQTYQFNFSVDVPLFLSFLHENFTRDRRKIVFITGNTVFDSPEMKSSIQKRLDISEAIAPLPNRFASHHTKMMVNFFENGEVEIAIMTCNLTTLDISGLTQALWRSGRMGKGPTTTTLGKRFRFDLLRYFSRYGLSVTRRLMSALEKVDFSSVDVELVASAPGVYDVKSSSVTGECYGYAKLRQVLERNDLLIKDTSPKHNILSQVTSIAYPYTSHKGNTSSVFSHILCPLMFEEWSGDLSPGAQAFENHQQMYNYAPHIIFPTKRDVAQSNLGYLSGAAVHFKYEGSAAHKAQYEQNIKKYLYKWSHSGNATGREHITPHVKYYACDNGDDWRSLKWVMVGSHNLSKQAWGYPKPKTGGTKMDVSSYELSVLVPSGKQKLVPTYGADTLESYKGNPVRFPFLLPPTPYGSTDLPWSTESTCGSMKDRWGNSYP
ncbi:hypothetical protein JCM33374_g6025 [Metschnikowia sp. JCM 33374]|nr:hypothetical protein JCM33374_g6025 [Metschnikowia sp. JCM 33374]